MKYYACGKAIPVKFHPELGYINTGTIISLLALLAGLIFFFYSLCFDILSQYSAHFWGRIIAPFTSISTEYSITEFGFPVETSNTGKPIYVSSDTVLYLVVLDLSKSTKEALEKNGDKYRDIQREYRKIIPRINNRISNPAFRLDTNRVNYYRICKAKLDQTLLEISKINPSKFCIWSLGDEADKIFPSAAGNYLVSNAPASIDSSLHCVKAIIDTVSDNTNFISLFSHLVSPNEYLLNEEANYQEPTGETRYSVVLVLISDLIHSMEANRGSNIYEVKKRFNREKNTICKYINALSMTNTFTNIILITASDDVRRKPQNFEIDLLPLLQNYFAKMRVQEVDFSASNDELLFALNKLDRKSLNFYYTATNFIEASSVTIEFCASGQFEFCLFTVENYLDTELCISSYSYNLLSSANNIQIDNNKNIEDDSCRFNGRIPLNQKVRLPAIKEGERLKITYSGVLPGKEKQPYLAIYNNDTKKFSLVPTFFIRRIPWEFTLAIVSSLLAIITLLCLPRQ